MADFDVAIRNGYRDIGGLVLDCLPFDYRLNARGQVLQWYNRAPRARSGRGRFGDPYYDDSAPTGFAYLAIPFDPPTRAIEPTSRTPTGAVRFKHSEQQALAIPSVGSFGAKDERWTVAYEIANQTDNGPIVGGNNADDMRLTGADGGVRLDSNGSFTVGSGHTNGVGVVQFRPSHVDWTGESGGHLASLIAGGTTADYSFTFDADQAIAAYIARSQDADEAGSFDTDYMGADLYSVRIWRKRLSNKERDLAARTLKYTGASLSTSARCAVALVPWRDGTGQIALHQGSRIRPLHAAEPLFYLATLPAAGSGVVQFGCEIAGLTLPDADLSDSNLFTIEVLERPVSITVAQDSGWSSVFDVTVYTPGHYTLLFSRQGHGGRIVHLDVQAAV